MKKTVVGCCNSWPRLRDGRMGLPWNARPGTAMPWPADFFFLLLMGFKLHKFCRLKSGWQIWHSHTSFNCNCRCKPHDFFLCPSAGFPVPFQGYVHLMQDSQPPSPRETHQARFSRDGQQRWSLSDRWLLPSFFANFACDIHHFQLAQVSATFFSSKWKKPHDVRTKKKRKNRQVPRPSCWRYQGFVTILVALLLLGIGRRWEQKTAAFGRPGF